MGVVYEAEDLKLGRHVALKFLPDELAHDTQALSRFQREGKAASSLNHPNICTIHEIDEAEGRTFIAMELLEGQTLRYHIASKPLEIKTVLDLGIQIASGLAAAHDKGITHRDLKPENIFVTKDGRAKILDFGLAKLTERNKSASQSFLPTESAGTMPGMVLGTVGYMAPEQVRGLEADHHSDIFAFGAILYEMLSGKRAFRGDTPADTMSAILREDPPDLTETNRNVAPALERIVRHCLEKTPEQRFQSARDIAFDLDVLSSVSSSAQLATIARAKLSGSRRRALFAVVGTLGLSAALALAWWSGTKSARVQLPTYKPITFRRGTIGNARFGPDGQTVVYSAAWEGSPGDLYTGRVDSLGERALNIGDAHLVAISPTSQIVIRTHTQEGRGFDRRGLLSIVPMAGGAPRPVMENVEDADWSPDGKEMAVVRYAPDKDYWQLQFPVGKTLLEGSNWISSPHVSPDGRRVTFFDHGNANGDDRGAVAVLDLDGKNRKLSDGWASLEGLAWSPDGKEVWFSGTNRGAIHNLYAVSLGGKLRPLASMPADVILEDVTATGKALLMKHVSHLEIYAGQEGQSGERKLDWLDASLMRNISDDGKFVLFSEEAEGGGPDYTVYMRPTDGGPAEALGHGTAVALSPDNQWALTATLESPSQFILQPTGAGEPRPLTHDQIDHLDARFLPDGKRLVFLGHEPGRPSRLFLLDLDTGSTKPLTPEGTAGGAVSPDGKFVMVRSQGKWMMWPVQGGEPTPVPGLNSDDRVMQWADDGKRLYLTHLGEFRPLHVYIFDLATQKRTLWKSLGPADWTGVGGVGLVVISRDGKHYAYQAIRSLADLYYVTGLK